MSHVVYSNTRQDLEHLPVKHDTFVGIDSDGCVFDTMEIKQKQCFHGLIISHWRLAPVAHYVRETAEFVNLYSRWRGQNRFLSLLKVFDLLRERPEVQDAHVPLPDLSSLRDLAASGVPLGNPVLADRVSRTGDSELASVLQWSLDVNRKVASTVSHVPPFPKVRECLTRMRAHSDIICISQTPGEALLREWKEQGLTPFVALIAAQEQGTKSEQLALAVRGRYAEGRVLVIGDALGDLAAARDNNALFFPILPGEEAASWTRFHEQGYSRFLEGRFAGAFQDELIAEFRRCLPDNPPWRRGAG